jgi:hypothetical protein
LPYLFAIRRIRAIPQAAQRGGHRPSDEKMAAYRPDAPPSEQFSNPVRCVRIANDALVYVCDRANDRIEVLRKDGTFVKEFRIAPETMQNGLGSRAFGGPGAKIHLHCRRRQRQIITINRDDGKVLAQWGRHGRQPGQFKWVHNIAIDSKGNIYTAEVGSAAARKNSAGWSDVALRGTLSNGLHKPEATRHFPVIARSSCDEAIQFFLVALDCFAEPVIGRAFARPVGSQRRG